MTDTLGKQSEAPHLELEELARRLLDLWQDQLTAVAANPDLAAQAARLMAAMPLPGMWLSQLGQMGGGPETNMTTLWAKMTQNWAAQDWGKEDQNAGSSQTTSANVQAANAQAGAPTATPASQPGGVDLDELSRRLAGIEQRLGELAQPQAKPVAPSPKPRTTANKPRRTRPPDPGHGSGGAAGGAAE